MGRAYRNLSQPVFEMANDDDVVVPMRDGVVLLADVHRPSAPGKYPVMAASPYPRQIQNLGAPAGFIEAGGTSSFNTVFSPSRLSLPVAEPRSHAEFRSGL